MKMNKIMAKILFTMVITVFFTIVITLSLASYFMSILPFIEMGVDNIVIINIIGIIGFIIPFLFGGYITFLFLKSMIKGEDLLPEI